VSIKAPLVGKTSITYPSRVALTFRLKEDGMVFGEAFNHSIGLVDDGGSSEEHQVVLRGSVYGSSGEKIKIMDIGYAPVASLTINNVFSDHIILNGQTINEYQAHRFDAEKIFAFYQNLTTSIDGTNRAIVHFQRAWQPIVNYDEQFELRLDTTSMKTRVLRNGFRLELDQVRQVKYVPTTFSEPTILSADVTTKLNVYDFKVFDPRNSKEFKIHVVDGSKMPVAILKEDGSINYFYVHSEGSTGNGGHLFRFK